MTDDWISIQVTGNVLAEVFTIILIGINRYQAAFIVEYSFQWTIVCICYNIFLIITDYRVYCGINNEDCIEDYPSTTILAVIMLLLHKKISFSIYLNNFITSIVTLFVYLIFNFVFNPIKTYKLAYETFMLIIVVVMNITSS